jgi:hypothetical protein
MNTPVNTSPQISYLLSFLGVLVDRAGGELVIENLSEYASHNLQLGMKLDAEHDRVTLRLSGGITKRAADLAVCTCETPVFSDDRQKICGRCSLPLANR